ncbi:hypothetical protein CONLIGDRAFT_695711 [Coniochaeta ligniaria NRRL 30616]|uniref:Uncharacterized protein n=1 Tax=Coniochaeta ligniaria NRRL 30616 TaxID=1408157 RepID=A0A1J7J192_9PEZI|nr:hypothetical protein CONLIGDRAFT_695711 [Coniochaeta ligniaria NRRL 30616]
MSSLLSRSRSLRKPAGGELRQKKDADPTPDNQSNARNLSPSRLPLKGLSSTASTTRPTRAASTAASKSEDSGAPPAPRSRPVSGVFGLGRSASVRQPSQSATSSSATATSRPPITTRSRPGGAARPTSASGPSPTTSRPTTSSGLPSSTSTAPPPRGHTRTKSSATTLTSSTILRPPSQTQTTSALRPPTSRPLHARHQSTSSAGTTSSTAPTAPPLRKPAFTTLQQHFSPAKNLAPKPLTSTFLAPPSPSKLPTNIAITAETARLQTELLQLHLLHRDADAVSRQWEASARQKLGEKFARVAAEEERVRGGEGRMVEAVNAAAIRAWGRGRGKELEERVGLLDGVVTAVWGVGEKGGRYPRVVRRFERWAEGVRDVMLARERVRGGGEVVFVGDLDGSWKEDCAGLVRRLGECRDTLGFLGRGEGDAVQGGESSLGRILRGVETLVDDMLAELELMLDIEREAVRGENEWVRGLNRSAGEDDTPRAGAIWRAF